MWPLNDITTLKCKILIKGSLRDIIASKVEMNREESEKMLSPLFLCFVS